MALVGIVNYGAGNIRSIENALDHVGARVRLVSRAQDFEGLTHALLPGVGSFAFCRERLHASGLLPSLEDWTLRKRRPLLGICVGMQLLTERSHEHGDHAGLGWIAGQVLPLHAGGERVRIPHVGWNEARFVQELGQFDAGDEADFYFDHSFALFNASPDQAVATCCHGAEFTVVARNENILACQFHPEKSQDAGLSLLRSFVEAVDHA